MNTQNPESPFDPLRRVFVPVERPVHGGREAVLRTTDGDYYIRDLATGVIRRHKSKVNGKVAKRIRREARR